MAPVCTCSRPKIDGNLLCCIFSLRSHCATLIHENSTTYFMPTSIHSSKYTIATTEETPLDVLQCIHHLICFSNYRWSLCSSDAYINEFDGPPMSCGLTGQEIFRYPMSQSSPLLNSPQSSNHFYSRLVL